MNDDNRDPFTTINHGSYSFMMQGISKDRITSTKWSAPGCSASTPAVPPSGAANNEGNHAMKNKTLRDLTAECDYLHGVLASILSEDARKRIHRDIHAMEIDARTDEIASFAENLLDAHLTLPQQEILRTLLREGLPKAFHDAAPKQSTPAATEPTKGRPRPRSYFPGCYRGNVVQVLVGSDFINWGKEGAIRMARGFFGTSAEVGAVDAETLEFTPEEAK